MSGGTGPQPPEMRASCGQDGWLFTGSQASALDAIQSCVFSNNMRLLRHQGAREQPKKGTTTSTGE